MCISLTIVTVQRPSPAREGTACHGIPAAVVGVSRVDHAFCLSWWMLIERELQPLWRAAVGIRTADTATSISRFRNDELLGGTSWTARSISSVVRFTVWPGAPRSSAVRVGALGAVEHVDPFPSKGTPVRAASRRLTAPSACRAVWRRLAATLQSETRADTASAE